MPRLSAIDRERAIGRLQAGNRPAAIANVMGVATSTICCLWTRFQASGSTRDGARSGRPRVTTARQDRVIYRQHLRQQFLPATETSRNTVNRLVRSMRARCQALVNANGGHTRY
ncbi:hypothetical protein V1264_004736 [Littorina saxatilis]|uniref:Uncharacterized protein n=1 Tax=Littorina saxatilis TaxID=31220 RepID=A0AAN9B2T2_9CAEN